VSFFSEQKATRERGNLVRKGDNPWLSPFTTNPAVHPNEFFPS